MSTGRQSWKTAASGRRRNTRKLKIGLLATVLGGILILLGLMIGPGFTPAPRTYFHTLQVDANGNNFAGQASERRIHDLFEKLNARPGKQQGLTKPVRIENLSDLPEVGNGDTLVLYCSRQAVVVDPNPEDFKDELDVRLGMQHRPILFKELLEGLGKQCNGQSVLLLDLTGPLPGLANGVLADDVGFVIDRTIKDQNNRKLTVICSRSHGERSREWAVPPPPTDSQDPNVAHEETVASPASISPQFTGTAFAHFVEQSLRERPGDSDRSFTIQELFDSVRNKVGDQQTVRMPATGSQVADTRLPRIKPEPESDEDNETAPETAAEPVVAAETVSASDDKELEQPEPSPWEQLITRRRSLQETAAVADGRWVSLNDALIRMRLALLNDRPETAGQHEHTATRLLTQLKTTNSADSSEEVRPWMAVTLTTATSDDSTGQGPADQAGNLLDSLMEPPEESDQSIRERMKPPGKDTRAHLVIALVKKLSELAEAAGNSGSDPQAVASSVKQLVQAIRHIEQKWSVEWPQKDWPHELWTLHKVLVQQETARQQTAENSGSEVAGGDVPMGVVRELHHLINLQRTAFLLAGGYRTNGAPTLKDVWNQEREKVKSSVSRLHAARRWLALGSKGVPWASQLLGSADEAMKSQDIPKACHDWFCERRFKAERPAMIQFLAGQLEDAALSKEGLTDLLNNDVEMAASDWPSETLRKMELSHLQHMFRLTGREQTGAAAESLQQYNSLEQYIKKRQGASDLSTRERHRLLLLPVFDHQPDFGAGGVLSMANKPGTETQTGVCLGFWSIRLLESVTRNRQEELRKQWKGLVGKVLNQQQNGSPSASAEDLIQARIKLAQALQQTWKEFRDESAKQQSVDDLSDFYVQVADTNSVMNISGYKAPPQATIAAPPEKMLTDSQRTPIEITFTSSETERFLYVLLPEDKGLRIVEGERDETWWTVRVEAGTESKEISIVSEPGSSLTAPTELTVALVEEAKTSPVLLAYQPVTLRPNDSTTWEAEFLYLTGEPPKQQKLELIDVKNLKLPPTTTLNDALNNVQVQLKQTSGNAEKAEVTCVFGAGESIPQTLSVQPLPLGGRGVVVPFPLEESEKTTPTRYEITTGLTFQITPYIDEQPALMQKVGIQPQLANRAHDFVAHRPSPRWDPRTLMLTMEIKSRTDLKAWKNPTTLPVEIHFSPKLRSFLVAERSTRLKTSHLKEQSRFRFEFREIDDYSSLEFGLSVAGIPYAWWWQLQEENEPTLLGNSEPYVRAIVQVKREIDGQEVTEVMGDPFYLLDHAHKSPQETAPRRPFDVLMHLPRDIQKGSTLRLEIDPQVGPPRLLNKFNEVHGRYQERITVGPGTEENHWKFDTHTKLFAAPDVELDEGDGRHRLVATLEKDDAVTTDQTTVVIDRSPPETSVLINGETVLRGACLINFPSKVMLTVDAEDPQSEVDWDSLTVTVDGKPVEGKNNDPKTFNLSDRLMSPKPGETTKAQLIVTVNNKVGLSSKPQEAELRLHRRKKQSGTLILVWKDKAKRNLALRGNSITKQQGLKNSPVIFGNVPFGSGYRIQEGTQVIKRNIRFEKDNQEISLDEQ